MKRYLLILLLVLSTLTTALAGNKVIRILAIGNSFSEDAVEQYLYELGKEGGVELIIGNAYRGGQGFESHWKDVTTGANTFEYRKIVGGVKTNTRGQSLKNIIEDEPWDYITLQQVSQESGMPGTFEPYLTNLINYVKTYAKNKKLKLGYHMTWAYSNNSTHGGFANYGRNQLKMYNDICAAVKITMKKHKEFSFVIPSGTAIQNARSSRLGDTMNRDGYHLDYNIGRYIAACTWYETILKKNSLQSKYYPQTIDNGMAAIAHKAAHSARRRSFMITEIKN